MARIRYKFVIMTRLPLPAATLALLIAALCGCQRPPGIAWYFVASRPLFGRLSQALTPAVAGNTVFFCGGYGLKGRAQIYAINLETGEPKWRRNVESCIAPPLVSGNTVIAFGTTEGGGEIAVYGFDGANGNERWHVDLPGNPSPPAPVLAGDDVFFAPGSRSILRISAQDGSVQSFDIEAEATVASEGPWISSAPGEAIFGYAESVWTSPLHAAEPHASAPLTEPAGHPVSIASDGHILLLGDADGTLRAFELGKGTVLWRRQWRKILSMPALDGDKVFLNVSDGSPSLVVLALATGADLWRISQGGSGAPFLQNGRVYQASGSEVFVVDSYTGMIEAHFAAPAPVVTSPISAGGLVLFGTDHGVLYAAKPAAPPQSSH
jgi:outer membrane protein assembly factor BamB